MTACISVGGLVPLLFATGPGSEIQRPLAIVVIGGLISSTLLTLLLLPLVYERFGLPREDLGATTPQTPQPQQAYTPGSTAAAWPLLVLSALLLSAFPAYKAQAQTAQATAVYAPQALSAEAERALATSSTWQAQWRQWQAERLQADQSRVSDQPWVPGIGVDRIRQRNDPGRPTGWEHTLSLSRGVSWPERQAAGARWASLRQDEADVRLRWAWQQLQQTLIEQWGQWMEARWTLDAWQAQETVLAEQLQQMARRHQLGDAAKVDVLVWQAALAQARSQLQQAQGEWAAADTALRVYLNDWRWPLPAQPLAQARFTHEETRLPPPDSSPNTPYNAPLEAQVARRNADSLQGEADWMAQQVRPTPTWTVQWGRNSLSAEQRIGMAWSWPLDNPSQAQAARAARRQAEAALAQAEGAARQAQARQAQLLARMQALQQAWLSADQAREALTQHAQALARGLALGTGTSTDVVQARRLAMDQTLEAARLAARCLTAEALWQLNQRADLTPQAPLESP
jgi:outer membrane protein TolC